MSRTVKSYLAVFLAAGMILTGIFSSFAQITEVQPEITESAKATASEEPDGTGEIAEETKALGEVAEETEAIGEIAEESEMSEDAAGTEEAEAVPEDKTGEAASRAAEAAGADGKSAQLADGGWDNAAPLIYWGIDAEDKLWLSTATVSDAQGEKASGSVPAKERLEGKVAWRAYKYKTSIRKAEVLAFDEDGLRTSYTEDWFCGCTNLTEVKMEKLNTTYTVSMKNMFAGCTSLRILDISNISLYSYPDCYRMFAGCSNLETILQDSQSPYSSFRELLEKANEMFVGCNSLTGSGRGYCEDTHCPYISPYEQPGVGFEFDGTYARVNGYYGIRGYFTEKNDDVAYDGAHVRFNHKWINYSSTPASPMPDGSITVNLAAGYGAKKGWITLYRENGIVNKVVLKDVQMDNRDYERDEEEENPAVLFIDSKIAQDLTVRFEGDNNIIFVENPQESDDSGDDALLVLATCGSKVTVECAEGATEKMAGANFSEYRTGNDAPETEFIFNDLNMQAHQYGSYGFLAYATKLTFNDCELDVWNGEDALCMILGVGNERHEDDAFTVTMNRSRVQAVNCASSVEQSSFGTPSPSALNISHTHVLWNACDMDLWLPYAPLGECRGLFMLHGGLTMHGGTAKIICGDKTGELEKAPMMQMMSAAIQAVYVTIDDGAAVKLQADSYIGRPETNPAWGIVFARNTVIDHATVDILASGSDCAGIYYFGRSTDPDPADDPAPDLWEEYLLAASGSEAARSALAYVGRKALEEIPALQCADLICRRISESLATQETPANAYHPYGDVILRDSDVNMVLRADKVHEGEAAKGVTGRHLYMDLPYNSQKQVNILAEDLHGNLDIAVMAYDFGDGNITLQNAAYVKVPEGAAQARCESAQFFDEPYYTYLWGDEIFPLNQVSAITFAAKTGGSGGGGSSSGSGRAKSVGAIGSKDAPVTAGSWIQAADGSWSYSAPQLGQEFKNVWAYIANPYAGGKPDWFFFDPFGKMLTGWQWLFWNGAYHCYYLNPMSNGMLGACQLGGVTPDGYTVDGTGAWTVDGKAVER